MRSLLPCRVCGRHVFCDEAECPFCNASLKRPGGAPALLVGSALLVAAACGGSVTVTPGGGGGIATSGAASQTTTSTQPGTAGAGGTPGIGPITLHVGWDAGETLEASAVADARDASEASAEPCAGNPCPDISFVCDTCPACDGGFECVPLPHPYHSPPHRLDWSWS